MQKEYIITVKTLGKRNDYEGGEILNYKPLTKDQWKIENGMVYFYDPETGKEKIFPRERVIIEEIKPRH